MKTIEATIMDEQSRFRVYGEVIDVRGPEITSDAVTGEFIESLVHFSVRVAPEGKIEFINDRRRRRGNSMNQLSPRARHALESEGIKTFGELHKFLYYDPDILALHQINKCGKKTVTEILRYAERVLEDL